LAYNLRSLTIAEDRGQLDISGVTSGVTLDAQFELPRRCAALTPKIGVKTALCSRRLTVPDTDLGALTVWWDTGSTASLLSKRVVQKTRLGLAKDQVVTQQLIFGTKDFGPMKFEVMEMALPPGFDGFIGYSFLCGMSCVLTTRVRGSSFAARMREISLPLRAEDARVTGLAGAFRKRLNLLAWVGANAR
jgi:hypothetical protein